MQDYWNNAETVQGQIIWVISHDIVRKILTD